MSTPNCVNAYDLFTQPASVTRFMLQDAPVRSERGETLFAYDAFGRRSKVARPGDTLEAPTQEFAYHLSSPLSRIVTRGRSQAGAAPDLEQRECVDGLGRPVQSRTRLSEGVYQVDGFHEVNPQGRPVRTYQGYRGGPDCDVTPPRGVAFRAHYYDGMGRPLSVTEPDAALYGKASVSRMEYAPLSILTFDAEDNDLSSPHHDTPHGRVSDGLGRPVRFERLLSANDPVARVTALWDSLGRLAGYVDPGGQKRGQTYDLLGRVIAVDDPNAGHTEFTYDPAGNLRSRTDARGLTVRTEYDGANRPVAYFDADHRKATEVSTRYDFEGDCAGCARAEGQVARTRYPLGAQAGMGSDEHAYDPRGREVSMIRSLQGHAFVLSREYDNADRLVGRTYPDGTELRYRFDGASRPIAIDGVLDTVAFDDQGSLSTLHYHNGTRLALEHDTSQRLRAARTYGVDGAVLQGVDFERDRVGNLLAIEDRSDRRDGTPIADATFTHDSWYRLTGATYGADSESIGLGFDVLDNITHKVSSFGEGSTMHAGQYLYDAAHPNRVLQTDASRFDFDAAGRTTGRDATSLQHDYLGRLQRADAPAGRQGLYAYDAGVDRVMERHDGGTTYYIGPDFEVRDGIGVTYARLGRSRVARLSTTTLGSRVLTDHNGDARLDVGDAWLSQQRRPAQASAMPHLRACARRLLLEAGESRVFLHDDHLGSLTLATDGDGAVVGARAYYPFGAVRHSVGYVDDYGFTGQRTDPTTGLLHMRMRELDAVTGRWTSPDPLFEVMEIDNLALWGEATAGYAYVAGRPMVSVDPTGLLSLRAGALGVAALAVTARTSAFSIGGGRGAAPRTVVPGTATVFQHGVHVSVVTQVDGQLLHTHLTPNSIIGREAAYVSAVVAGRAPDTLVTNNIERNTGAAGASFTVDLPDAAAARAFQLQALKRRHHGPYDIQMHNCAGHVCDVLEAGGLRPSGGSDVVKALGLYARAGFETGILGRGPPPL